ncbi:putative ABC transport integral membrane subunit [Yersinia pseudotuberculosis]|nr:putative ABC transport integral membrane subunit [Yersinia pseudotuberculosis]
MKPAETKPDNTAVGDVKSIKPGLRFWFWLKDPLCWALLILCGLVFGMTSLQRFFTALFPELDRPIYLQDTFFHWWSLMYYWYWPPVVLLFSSVLLPGLQ